MDRKYRQKGYMDNQSEQPKEKEKPKSPSQYAKPSPRIETRFMAVMRCPNCSALIETMDESIAFTDQCKKCAADLHSCKNCRYFDPAARFECQKPIEARIAKKNDRNMCLQFAAKVSLEKQQPQQEVKQKEAPNTARKAFDDLFKK